MKRLTLWALLWALYLIFAGAADIEEVFAGGLVSFTVTALSLPAGSGWVGRFLPRLRWLVPVYQVPGTVLQESWLLLTALVRKLSGRFEGGSFIDCPLPPVSQEELLSRHAITTIGICLTPNDYIVSIDKERNSARIRILVGRKLSGADTAFLELT